MSCFEKKNKKLRTVILSDDVEKVDSRRASGRLNSQRIQSTRTRA